MLDRVIIRKYEIGFERIFGLLGERILKMGKRGFVTEYALQIEGNRFKLTKEQYEFLKERENRYVASRIYENNGYENFEDMPHGFICADDGFFCCVFCLQDFGFRI